MKIDIISGNFQYEVWSNKRPLPNVGDTISIKDDFIDRVFKVVRREWMVEEVTAAGPTFWNVILYCNPTK